MLSRYPKQPAALSWNITKFMSHCWKAKRGLESIGFIYFVVRKWCEGECLVLSVEHVEYVPAEVNYKCQARSPSGRSVDVVGRRGGFTTFSPM